VAEQASDTAAQRERLREVVGSAMVALQSFARESNLTNDELMTTLGFIKEVADADELILLCDVLGISQLVDDQTHASDDGTANNVLGPFYIAGAPQIDNPGSIAPQGAAGEQIELLGRVTDAAGGPVRGAELDIWQADGEGRYSNEVPDGDQWALRGRQTVTDDGSYRLKTVKPRHYTVKHDGPVGRLLEAIGRHPWRPAHVHFLVTAPGYRRLATQAYVAGGPYLDDDAISGVKSSLVVPVVDGQLRFDITLARE